MNTERWRGRPRYPAKPNPPPPRKPTVLDEVRGERKRQDEKWGEQNHKPLYWLGIIGEEFGELSKELIENDPQYAIARYEALQLAACVVAFIESLDRNELGG